MRPRFVRRIDRLLFSRQVRQDRLEKIADVAIAVTIGLSLAAVLWG